MNYRQARINLARQELANVPTIPTDCHRTMSLRGEHSLTTEQEQRTSLAIAAAAKALRERRPEPKAVAYETREFTTLHSRGRLIGAVER